MFSAVSCETDAETVAEISGEAGAVVTVDYSDGKILGTVDGSLALADAPVTFTDVSLDFDARLTLGNEAGVLKYELVKSFNGGAEIFISETPALPLNVTYTTIGDYLADTGVVAGDLRIGDVFKFNVKVHKTDGTVLYYNASMGEYKVVVNCSSDLAGDYAWGTYQPLLTLDEVGAGRYYMPYLGSFSGIYWFEFEDQCGVLTIVDFQFAASNPITQSELGYIDGPTGDIIFPKVSVGGVSWYVDLEVRYNKL